MKIILFKLVLPCNLTKVLFKNDILCLVIPTNVDTQVPQQNVIN